MIFTNDSGVPVPNQKNRLPDEIFDDLAGFENDPWGWVLWAFDWGVGVLEKQYPEPWQEKVLKDVRDGLMTLNEAIQYAVASGHGVGKSALVAWLILWAMSTMGDTRGIITANTQTQLQTKTWPELGKWYHLFIAKEMFKFTATALYSADPNHEKTWRIDAIPWSDANPEAFAGLHNKNKRILIIFDEASAIADKIFEVIEGALTDSDTQILWFIFGNPTRSSGRFHAAFHGARHRWKNMQVDSRTVSFTNKKQIQKWIDDLGEDSDFVRIRVRGVFPSSSPMQFIPSDYVERARGKHLKEEQYNFAPVILTLDNAWTGGDEVVIGKRQGLAFSILMTAPKNDNDAILAGHMARLEDEHHADAVFIDYGYGTGVYSVGKTLGRDWMLIEFGGASNDRGYLNKRAEMYKEARDWLRDGGAIPNDPILCADLVGPEGYVVPTGKNAGKIYLESKDDMAKRGLPSPNRGDALVISFAHPVKKKDRVNTFQNQNKRYDVLDMEARLQRKAYNPLKF